MPSDPLFIIGTERSGSNLLRVILNSHPNIVIPHPPHIMRYFRPLEARYGDLARVGNLRWLVNDVLRLVRAHIHPWSWVPRPDDVMQRTRASRRTGKVELFSVYVAIHEALRERVRKDRWGCKSTFMIDEVERVVEEWPGARLLWLYRDPRDVAASSRHSVFSTFHPYYTAQLWTAQQKRGLALEAAGIDLLRVRYEELAADPDGQIRRICTYLGEEFHPHMLEFFKGKEARASSVLAESWKNTAQPVNADGLERWRKDLTVEEVVAVEGVAAETMERLGYPPDRPISERSVPPDWMTRLGWWFSDKKSWIKVEIRSFRKDRNVRLRWRRAMLLQRIRLGLVLRGR
jgi:hypothetical protein